MMAMLMLSCLYLEPMEVHHLVGWVPPHLSVHHLVNMTNEQMVKILQIRPSNLPRLD